jgi:hypothetical protein
MKFKKQEKYEHSASPGGGFVFTGFFRFAHVVSLDCNLYSPQVFVLMSDVLNQLSGVEWMLCALLFSPFLLFSIEVH